MSFLNTVPEHLRPFVSEIDAYLLDKDCKRSIKPAAKDTWFPMRCRFQRKRCSISYLGKAA